MTSKSSLKRVTKDPSETLEVFRNIRYPDAVTAVSSSPQALQSGLASVTRRRAPHDAKSSVQKPGKTNRGRRVRREGDGGDRESPDSLEGGGRRSRDKRSQSLPRNTLRGHSEEHLEGSVERNGRKKEKGNERREDRSGRSKSEERVRRVERTSKGDESKNKPTINKQRLPEPKLQWEEDEEDDECERERERLKDKEWEDEEEEEEEEERKSKSDREWEREIMVNKEGLEWELNKKTERGIPGELNGEQEISFHKRLRYLGVRVLPSDIQPRTLRPLSGLPPEGPAGDAEFNRTPFSFLTSGPSDDTESESGASVSECSMSAASISGLSVYLNNSKTTQRAPGPPLPGPWLKPSSKRTIREAERIRMVRSALTNLSIREIIFKSISARQVTKRRLLREIQENAEL
ncbi:unnamed protein product [Leuciscus chuanchicus]